MRDYAELADRDGHGGTDIAEASIAVIAGPTPALATLRIRGGGHARRELSRI
jgi:hypothetical protein